MLNQIVTGDARELAKEIEPESIDLIFCDPIYSNIEDYAWLAETALRVLKPGGAVLAWISKQKIIECHTAMLIPGLSYQTTLYYVVQCKQARPLFLYGVINWTTPCLVFAKGKYKCSPFIPDTIVDAAPSQNAFEWQKNTGVIEKWLLSFSKPGDIVFDPFAGSGTVPAVCKMIGRNYIGFEIEPDRAEKARMRVELTPLPLFVMEQEQQQRMVI
jgi:DNA modification methylase